MRVLIIEDHPAMRDIITGYFRDRGFAADAVGRGDEALAAMATAVYDAVILDLGLPDMDGLDIDEATMRQVLAVDSEAWREEVPLIEKHFGFIGARLPHEIRDQLADLEKRLAS